ncbi:hypothetical protein [Actinoplanes sp. ATCC 53533]|uniref:hypothetical protein n=1 Tax=Actinoplanes sp. ATCC 53533 TaxID=1288362 RepID=UPI001F17556C|nr:hypothetical protein [Actinoplanes sp. ATCC 53533]
MVVSGAKNGGCNRIVAPPRSDGGSAAGWAGSPGAGGGVSKVVGSSSRPAGWETTVGSSPAATGVSAGSLRLSAGTSGSRG